MITATISPIEHWCADGCGEVLEDKGSVQLVRRYVLRLTEGPQGVAFRSQQEALDFAKENGIEIHADTSGTR